MKLVFGEGKPTCAGVRPVEKELSLRPVLEENPEGSEEDKGEKKGGEE